MSSVAYNDDSKTTVDCWSTVWTDHDIQSVELQPLAASQRVKLAVGQEVTVGRSDLADCCVDHDDRLSRFHFTVECQRNRAILRDLGSRNGTLLNGKKVEKADIVDGDVIIAGSTVYRVSLK